jgi:hypothetical protein
MEENGPMPDIELSSPVYSERAHESGLQNMKRFKRRIKDSYLIRKPSGYLSIINAKLVKKYIRGKRLMWITYNPLFLQQTGLRPGMIIFPGYIVRKRIYKSSAPRAMTRNL